MTAIRKSKASVSPNATDVAGAAAMEGGCAVVSVIEES
jgi:hypothetical protein